MLIQLIEIVKHTPVWVWGLLAFLLVIGLLQTRSRRMVPAPVIALPVLMTAYAIYGVLSSFGPRALTMGAFLIGLAAGLIALRLAARASGDIRYAKAGRGFELPGSWLPLALIVGLFAAKYVVGVLLALHSAVVADPSFAPVSCAVFGLFSGAFIARALGVLRTMRLSA